MGRWIEIRCPAEHTVRAYFAEAGPNKPGVVVIQEWWGVNSQIRGVVDRLAAAGWNALAPDLYGMRVTQRPDEASHWMAGLDFLAATQQEIRGAVWHLAAAGAKVAVLGFCMGGALAIVSGVHIPEVAAVVCFYGIPPRDIADPAKIAHPFQGHFARHDDWCTPERVADLERALASAGRQAEIYHYDAAHAFFNEQRPEVHNPQAAAQAWQRVEHFLAKHLCDTVTR